MPLIFKIQIAMMSQIKIISISVSLICVLLSCRSIEQKPDSDIILLSKKMQLAEQKFEILLKDVTDLKTNIEKHNAAINIIEKTLYKTSSSTQTYKKIISEPFKHEFKENVQVEIKHAIAKKNVQSASSEAENIYKRAIKSFYNGDFKQAEILFDSIINKHPDHDFVDDALYWTAESRVIRKDYSGAITIYKQLLEEYSESNKIPDTLLKIGKAFRSLDDVKRSRWYLIEVISKYPNTKAGIKAEIILQEISIDENPVY